MKPLALVLLLCAVVFAEDTENYVDSDEGNNVQMQGWILGMTARDVVREMLKQLPCGYPDAGIPPMAPYTNEELLFNLTIPNSNDLSEFSANIPGDYALSKFIANPPSIDSLNTLSFFRFDGLDQMNIKSLTVSYIGKKVSFDFDFPYLTAKASRFETDTIVNYLRELGIKIRYDTAGALQFRLTHFRFAGKFKYHAPFLFGSIRIRNFRLKKFSLGSCESNIGGIAGNGKLNRLINDKIEQIIMDWVAKSQQTIEDYINANVVPQVNKFLKGSKAWDLIFNKKPKKCVPQPPPF